MLPHVLLNRLSYANVASTVCLFTVLGGSAYAAVSITGKDVRNGSLTSADIKDHSLRARDFRAASLLAGSAGPKGDPGRDGVPGAKGDPGAGVTAPPAAIRQPAGRLTLSGITGAGPGGTIEVRSVAWSNVMSGYDAGSGAGALKIGWGDLMIAKAPDSSSAEIWKRTATGQHITSGKLELLAQNADAAYATYAFKDLSVKAFSTQGSGDKRQDEVRLGFNTAMAPNPVFTFDPSAPLAPLAEPRVGQMTVDGIAGEADLVLDTWNVTNTGGAPGGGTAQFGSFVVSESVGPSSPALLERFAAGKHSKSVTIKLLQPGSASVYSTYVLTDAVISSFAVIGDARPLERIGFDAAKIESTTTVPGGEPIRTCFDRKLMVTC